MRSEKQKMLAGEPYLASDPELVQERIRARHLTRLYNQTMQADAEQRRTLLHELLGRLGDDVWIEPPFYCDYGSNIYLASGAYFNFNCVILDCAAIYIGKNMQCGPAVQIYAAYHPTDAVARVAGPELAAPVRIGDNVWIGGGAIICPGVTIGDNTTIGAGSVVVKDVPANVAAAGNPCRVLRHLK
jgi:maltose O-acetyltransferase